MIMGPAEVMSCWTYVDGQVGLSSNIRWRVPEAERANKGKAVYRNAACCKVRGVACAVHVLQRQSLAEATNPRCYPTAVHRTPIILANQLITSWAHVLRFLSNMSSRCCLGYIGLMGRRVCITLRRVFIVSGDTASRGLQASSANWPCPDPDIESLASPPVGESRSRISLITSTTQLNEVIACLVQHGCKDITSSLEPEHCAQYPFARGGLGVIYQGELKDGQVVAIKCVEALGYWESSTQSRKCLKRTAKELYTWSKCEHPGVLKLLGFARFRGQIALVSPLMKAGPLTQYMVQHPSVDRLRLCIRLSEALGYLHSNGIVHGDVKPDNVILADQGYPQLADFGSATLTSDASLSFTRTTAVGFTTRFAAPELLEGNSCKSTFETDIYALGMTILYILTGELPYANQPNQPAIIVEVTIKKNLPPRPDFSRCLANQEAEDKLWSLLVQCWTHDPSDRLTALEVREGLVGIERAALIEHT